MSDVILSLAGIRTDLRGVCDNDVTSLSNVLVTPGIVDGVPCDAFLSATNGRIACIVPVSADKIGAVNESMPASLATGAKGKPVKVCLNGEWRREEPNRGGVKTSVAKAIEERPFFPPLHEVMPNVTSEYRSVTIMANELLALAKAINAESGLVTLLIPMTDVIERYHGVETGVEARTVIKPIGVIGDAGIGVVMPAAQQIEGSYRKAFDQNASTYNLRCEQYRLARYRAKENEPKPTETK